MTPQRYNPMEDTRKKVLNHYARGRGGTLTLVVRPLKITFLCVFFPEGATSKQELQEVLKFPIEKFWNLEAR